MPSSSKIVAHQEIKKTMSFQLKHIVSKAYLTYRNTTICLALFDAIEELIEENLLTPKQAVMLIHQFEFSLRKKMKEATNEMSNYYFSARQIIAYKKIKNTYHVLLEDVQFYNKIPPQIIQHYLKTYKDYNIILINSWKAFRDTM